MYLFVKALLIVVVNNCLLLNTESRCVSKIFMTMHRTSSISCNDYNLVFWSLGGISVHRLWSWIE